jgi:hypothetical protein
MGIIVIAAYKIERVLKLWEEYSEVCDYIPIADIPESKKSYSEFAPVYLCQKERST